MWYSLAYSGLFVSLSTCPLCSFFIGVLMKLTPFERIERIVFLLCVIVVMLDLYYWRP